MLRVVTWIASERHFAVETRCVVEVVPLLEARPMDGVQEWLRGLVNYHGRLVPLVDAGVLLGGAPVGPRRASRILILQLIGSPDDDIPGQDDDDHEDQGDHDLLALLVDRVLDVAPLDFDDPSTHPGLDTPEGGFLGPVAVTGTSVVQLLTPDRLLTGQQRTVLFGRVRNETP